MIRDMPSTQIVLATADLGLRAELRAALQTEPGFKVVGEASDQTGLFALRRQLQPDILLLDSALTGLVNSVVSSWPSISVLIRMAWPYNQGAEFR
jgi:DNA-binding NarL/FixJ family response regulator